MRPDRFPTSVALALLATGGAALLAPLAARAEQVRTIDSVIDEAIEIMEADGQGGGKITTEGGRQIALADVQQIVINPLESYYAAPGHARVVLRGGDVINAEVIGGSDLGIKLRGRSLGEVTVGLELVHGILFSPSSFNAVRVRVFEQRRLSDDGQDAVTLLTGGRTEGTIDLVDENGVKMESKTVGEVNFELDKVESLVLTELDPLEPPAPGPRLRVRLRDGSLVTGHLVSYQRGEKLVLDCRLAEALEIKAREIATITVVGGRTVYVSDLEPAKVAQDYPEPFDWDPRFAWKRDRTCLGDPIRLGGKVYERGLGVHSRTELTFDVEGKGFLELRATVALDDHARQPSEAPVSVTFQVIVDGKPRYADGLLIKPEDEPRLVKVDVKGAKELVLLVDIGEGGMHSRGHAVWADALLIGKKK